MKDKVGDIFGQIDALLGKRSAEALAEQTTQYEDFPMLTEIIDGHIEQRLRSEDGLQDQINPSERRVQERRANQRRIDTNISISTAIHSSDHANLLAVFDKKMAELFKLQQKKLEESIRQVIREEIERKLGK